LAPLISPLITAEFVLGFTLAPPISLFPPITVQCFIQKLNAVLYTSTSNAAKAELQKSSRTQITPVTIFSVYCHLASASGA